MAESSCSMMVCPSVGSWRRISGSNSTAATWPQVASACSRRALPGRRTTASSRGPGRSAAGHRDQWIAAMTNVRSSCCSALPIHHRTACDSCDETSAADPPAAFWTTAISVPRQIPPRPRCAPPGHHRWRRRTDHPTAARLLPPHTRTQETVRRRCRPADSVAALNRVERHRQPVVSWSRRKLADDRPAAPLAPGRNVRADLANVAVGSAADKGRLDEAQVLRVGFCAMQLHLEYGAGQLLLATGR